MSDDIFNEYLLVVLMVSMALNMVAIVSLYIVIQRAVSRVFKARNESFFTGAYRIIIQKDEEEEERNVISPSQQSTRKSLSKPFIKTREIRSTLLFLLIITFALLAFLPGSINTIVNTVQPDTFSMAARLVCYLLLTINSIVNPILYAFNIKNIKVAAKKLFRRIFCLDIPNVVKCPKMSVSFSTKSTKSTRSTRNNSVRD